MLLGVRIGFYLMGLVYVYLIAFHFNPFQFDLLGHISSAFSFSQGLFHEYNDHFFLGGIHGLFYPPLEDAVVSGVYFLTGKKDMILSFQIYLGFLALFYIYSIDRASSLILKHTSRAGFLVFMVLILNMSKTGVNVYQGLSFKDLFVIGLSSQILSMSFLFLLLVEMDTKKREWVSILLLSLVILSHIVTGLVGLFCVGIQFVLEKRKFHFKVFSFALLLSAFYWLPFLYYKNYLVTSSITLNYPVGFAVLWLMLALSLKGRLGRPVVLVSGVFLILTQILALIPSVYNYMPRFHYHRLEIYGLIFLGFSIFSVDRSRAFFLRAILFMLLLITGDFAPMHLSKPEESRVSPDLISTPLTEYGRYWVSHDQRHYDFFLDNYFYLHHSDYKSFKGLYWESAYGNTLMSSYLATLHKKDGVLDFYYFKDLTCQAHQCLMDAAFAEFNILRWAVNLKSPWEKHSDSEQIECFQEIIKKKSTLFFDLKQVSSVMTPKGEFALFDVNLKEKFKNNYHFESNRVLQPIQKKSVAQYAVKMSHPFQVNVDGKFNSCSLTMNEPFVVLDEKTYSTLEKNIPKNFEDQSYQIMKNSGWSFEKVSEGNYKINIPSNKPVLFKIKLAPLPGLKLYDEKGNELQLYPAMHSLLAAGHGKMSLIYQKPILFYIGYMISLFSVLALGFRRMYTRI